MENEQKKKKLDLYYRQKELLDTFLKTGAISQAQYDKSHGDLVLKMGIKLLENGKAECLD